MKTAIELVYITSRVNCWLRFGEIAERTIVDRSRMLAFIEAGEIFAYIRWFANEYGTQHWSAYVVKAGVAGASVTRIPGVRPGGEVLCSFKGAVLSKRLLTLAEDLEGRGVTVSQLSENYWRQCQLRLHLRMTPHPVSSRDGKVEIVRRKALG